MESSIEASFTYKYCEKHKHFANLNEIVIVTNCEDCKFTPAKIVNNIINTHYTDTTK